MSLPRNINLRPDMSRRYNLCVLIATILKPPDGSCYYMISESWVKKNEIGISTQNSNTIGNISYIALIVNEIPSMTGKC